MNMVRARPRGYWRVARGGPLGSKPHMAAREIKAQGSQAMREASELFIRTL